MNIWVIFDESALPRVIADSPLDARICLSVKSYAWDGSALDFTFDFNAAALEYISANPINAARLARQAGEFLVNNHKNLFKKGEHCGK